jgi:hypothetical protein
MKEFGFIYSEEIISPDGDLRVVYGYSDGEKTPLIVEPRVIDVSSGEVLIDLWRTYCTSAVEFGARGKIKIEVQNPHTQAIICAADVDLADRTFSLARNLQKIEPLQLLRQIIIELRGN